MFGRSRKQAAKRAFSPKPKKLPARFAERILQLEMDLDYHCNLQTLKQLLELYSEAIEFFESLNDPRHMQYQERMQNLLMRRDVLAVMKSDGTTQQPAEPKVSVTDIKRKKEANDFNRRVRAQRMTNQVGVRNAERSAEKIVESQLNSSFNSSQVARNDLRSQRDTINSRLQERIRQRSAEPVLLRRKNKHSDTPVSPNKRFLEECDRSGGGFEADKVDFETEFEQLMESFVERKMTLMNEIKSRYLPQIEELESQKSEVVELVVENLKQQMNDEIATGVITLEEEKKAQIASLKLRAASSSGLSG